MNVLRVRYTFTLASGEREVFELELDRHTLELVNNEPEDPPEWTRLEFHQCPNCPLSSQQRPLCPVALKFANIAGRFEPIVSFDELRVEIETEERTISRVTTAQQALSSLMGLVMATSGCPHTAFFKPMARFHLPLATEEETMFRSVGTYLLAQYFQHKAGKPADIDLAGLKQVYENLRVVNASITKRLRAAGKTDSTLNAVVLLDLFAIIVPAAVEDSLQEIRDLLEPFIESLPSA